MNLDHPGRLRGITGVRVRMRRRGRVREGGRHDDGNGCVGGAGVEACWPPLKAAEGIAVPRAAADMRRGQRRAISPAKHISDSFPLEL